MGEPINKPSGIQRESAQRVTKECFADDYYTPGTCKIVIQNTARWGWAETSHPAYIIEIEEAAWGLALRYMTGHSNRGYKSQVEIPHIGGCNNTFQDRNERLKSALEHG
jgi:hypothetical protein